MLARTNARLADFEEAFHDAGIPFQGSSLLAARCRPPAAEAARPRRLDRCRAHACGSSPRRPGCSHALPDKLGERELTRQSDLARLVRLAAELDDGELTCSGFAAELRSRFDPGGQSARGVHLLTYHRAKGLEFDAVFLPRLEEKELPSKLARTAEDEAEERRLFYVGITRRERFLAITWSKRPSPFLAELGLGAPRRAPSPERAAARDATPRIRRSTSGARAWRARDEVPRTSSSQPDARGLPRSVRAPSPSSPRSRASARRSSSATAESCSASGRPRSPTPRTPEADLGLRP